MSGRGIGFTRWYDRIPELSQAVRMMERVPPPMQRLVAESIVRQLRLHDVAQQSEHGLKKLGTEKVLGLMKSKGKRRWYDQDPVVHQAFNYLYLMDDMTRYETAIKIMTALRALEELRRKEAVVAKESTVVNNIFDRPLFEIMEKTEFYVRNETDKAQPSPPKTEEGLHAASHDGVKLLRFK